MLLDIQRAICRSLIKQEDGPASEHILPGKLAPAARLSIYRNTFIGSLTTALRLSYPAIHRLVGAAFFETMARLFIEAHPPRSAYLDEYGARFPEFLAQFEPVASLAYLPGVARLEWAINKALHAPDAEALEVPQLLVFSPADHGRIAFVPHPSVSLAHAEHPVDEIWSAVLAQNDAAMMALDLDAGPVWLLVQRTTDIVITRLKEPEWRFLAELCASRSLQAAIDAVPDIEPVSRLAYHLASGHFADFKFIDPERAIQPAENVT
jgi:hypothetical protein